jgi:hypothetical protein
MPRTGVIKSRSNSQGTVAPRQLQNNCRRIMPVQRSWYAGFSQSNSRGLLGIY